MGGLNSDTKLLLHGSDPVTLLAPPDGSKEIVDSGNTGHIVTQVGTAQLSTAQKVYGSSSLLLDGDSDLVTLPDSSDWDIGANVTIDLRVKHVDHAGTECYSEQYVDATNYWVLEHIHGTGIHFQVDGGGADINISGGEITDTDWHHVCLIKVGSDVGIYLDGTQVAYGSANCTTSFADLLSIGARIDPTNYFAGNIGEFRIQASNYFEAAPVVGLTDTITVPTEQHTSDANTKLLLHMDTQDVSGDGGSGIYNIPTFVGNTQLDTSSVDPWGTYTGVFNFDGDGDYVSLPDSSSWDLVKNITDTQSIEMFVKMNNYQLADQYFLTQVQSDAERWAFGQFYSAGKSLLRFYAISSSGVKIDTGGVTFTDKGINDNTTWHHILLVKKENIIGIYKDGVQVCYASIPAPNVCNFTAPLRLACYNGVNAIWSNFLSSEIRFQSGNYFEATPNAELTDTITVPTEKYSLVNGVYLPNQSIIIM